MNDKCIIVRLNIEHWKPKPIFYIIKYGGKLHKDIYELPCYSSNPEKPKMKYFILENDLVDKKVKNSFMYKSFKTRFTCFVNGLVLFQISSSFFLCLQCPSCVILDGFSSSLGHETKEKSHSSNTEVITI